MDFDSARREERAYIGFRMSEFLPENLTFFGFNADFLVTGGARRTLRGLNESSDLKGIVWIKNIWI